MIAKRNIGTVFNLHRVANVLAAYRSEIKTPVKIDGKEYQTFEDIGTGTNSRNHKSALVANLILDNLKEQSADALNLNEHTVAAFTILTNLNVPLENIALIMNSPMVKEYVNLYNENNSAFHGYTRKSEILNQLSKRPVFDNKGKKVYYSPDKKGSPRGVISDPGNSAFYSSENQSAIIDMIMAMENVNSEIQAISKIMAGHNGIETNPYLLEKQIKRFRSVMNNAELGQEVMIKEAMANNPDMARYLKTAEATLAHTRKVNPVYRPAMTELLTTLSQTVNNDDLSDNQIKKYTGTIAQFLNSKLLNTNYLTADSVKALTANGNPRNVFNRLSAHIQKVKNEGNLETNLLLTQGLNMKFSGKGPYISLNTRFFDDSVTPQEIKRMQSEFMELDYDLREDLITYDLLKNGWGSPFSLLPIMSQNVNNEIKNVMEADFASKESQIFEKGEIAELERIIVAKDAIGRRNNFFKFDGAGKTAGNFAKQIQRNLKAKQRLLSNQPFYYTTPKVKGGKPVLYRFNGMPKSEFDKHFSDTNKKNAHLAMQVGPNSTEIKTGSAADLDIQLITISDVKKKFDPTPLGKPAGMEYREEYWEYDSEKPMDRATYDATLEFTKYDNDARKEAMFDKYLKEKERANFIYDEQFRDTDFNDMETEELLSLYDDYAGKDAYAFSIITTPIMKALANKIAVDQQQNFKGRQQGNKDIGFFKSFLMANNIPSDHPAVAGMVRIMEVKHKEFTAEKIKYLKKVNEATDALYKEKFGFDFSRKTPLNILKRFYYTFFIDRKALYQNLYSNLVETVEHINNGKVVKEFKLKSKEEIEQLKNDDRLTDAEYNFYTMFRGVTTELAPYSTEKNNSKRRDYIPHTSMGFFESFSNRGILGLMQNSKSENEQLYDVKVFVPDPEGKGKKLVPFKDVEDIYKAISVESGNNINKIADYTKLRLKAKKLLASGKNEDGSVLQTDPMAVTSALNMGIMNRFSNSRSIKASEMPSMDLNHALSSYIHSTLFINGNKNVTGFKHMQGVIDGVLAQADAKGHKNISKYVKINWKDAYLKNKKQALLGKNTDAVVDLMTKLNLFFQLGFKASFVIGNVAAGKYHNIKNGSPKEWIVGEKRFWGTDKSLNPLDAVKRFKRTQNILKNINFLDINVYDNVSIASQSRLDNFFGDLALMPMAWSEKWIQGVQFLGMLSEEEFNRFDDDGNLKPFTEPISLQRVTELENKVKRSQGKGYQATDQRMIQQYSLGRMFMQFSRFIPTMMHDRFAKHDVDIYGKEYIGSLRMLGKTIADVQSMKPKDYVAYRKSLSPEMRARLDSGLKGLAMSGLIGAFAIETGNQLANNTYWDANYYMNFDKLKFKMVPSAVRTTENLVESIL